MMKSLNVKFSIPKLCQGQWDALQGTGKRHHREQCQHAVFDLTLLSSEEIQALAVRQGGRLCGMMRKSQLSPAVAARNVVATAAVGLAMASCETTPVVEQAAVPLHEPSASVDGDDGEEEILLGDIWIEPNGGEFQPGYGNVMLDTLGPPT